MKDTRTRQLEVAQELPKAFHSMYCEEVFDGCWPCSESQIHQDMFVLAALGRLRGGYFVEFGAGDGRHLSNTYVLEKTMGWRGVVAEPCRRFAESLRKNRSCGVDLRAVWRKSGELVRLVETQDAHLSTAEQFMRCDGFAATREATTVATYDVETVSLEDLLSLHGAPPVVDYASVDVEGGELEVLRDFDFGKRSFRTLTVEHNHGPQRNALRTLLEEKEGYLRVLPEHSSFEDWYIGPLV